MQSSGGAADESISRENQEIDDHALSTLPKELREVFVLRHCMGVSFTRIAEGMPGSTANQVRMMYRRARARLVNVLDGKL